MPPEFLPCLIPHLYKNQKIHKMSSCEFFKFCNGEEQGKEEILGIW
jgi:hypothetical protein